MKSILLSIVALLISNASFSQMNYPIPMDSTSTWRLYTSARDGASNYSTSSDFRVFIAGDTTIGNHIYSRLLSSGVHSANYQGITWSTPYENEFYAYIRSDSSRTYIFFIDREELLFDFSLQVGDTLPMTFNNWSPSLVITSIDSVLVAGKYLKRFHIYEEAGGMGSTWYIEGIGHEQGLLECMNLTLDSGSLFECYAENHIPVFPQGSSCDLTVNVNDQPVSDKQILIYPNPSGGIFSITLKSDSEKYLNVKIMGVTGNLILSETWNIKQGENEKKINLSGASAGI